MPIDEDFEARALEAAAKVRCIRCAAVLLQEASVTGAVLVRYDVAATRQQSAGHLCGKCGLLFREFLQPHLVTDPGFQKIKKELMRRWG